MDEKRIKEAQNNFTNYLKDGMIKKVKFDKIVYTTYLRNARESLVVAKQLNESKMSFLWVVVTSYYSMFYMACAYLYKLGYKAENKIVHQVINESLIVQGRNKISNYLIDGYSEEKEKALVIVDSHLENYERERAKRSSFQYETTEEIKEAKAKTSLDRAKEFITLMEEILTKDM